MNSNWAWILLQNNKASNMVGNRLLGQFTYYREKRSYFWKSGFVSELPSFKVAALAVASIHQDIGDFCNMYYRLNREI